MGEGIAETGSDRRTEVPIVHTRTFGIFVRFFSLKSEGMSSPEVPDNSGFSESEPLPSRLSLRRGTQLRYHGDEPS